MSKVECIQDPAGFVVPTVISRLELVFHFPPNPYPGTAISVVITSVLPALDPRTNVVVSIPLLAYVFSHKWGAPIQTPMRYIPHYRNSQEGTRNLRKSFDTF